MFRLRAKWAILVICLLAAALSRAEIRYTVSPLTTTNRIMVQMEFDAKKGLLELQMPNWAPGAYILSMPGRNVQDFRLQDAKGGPLAFEKVGDSTWKANLAGEGKVFAEYSVSAPFTAGAVHYSGPSTYLYAVGRKAEKCRLKFNLPANWNVAIGLDPIRGSKTDYAAPDYDTLADNPATLGDYVELRYTVRGKPHFIALRGAQRDQVDRDKILRACKHISESQADFFGGLPYNRYVWHFSVIPGQDGGGGLEHLSSTQITLAAGVGPRSVRVLSHEFFHLWNVKRIRSKVLGPFDYTQLPKTGALYWLEGVTDYYASLLLLRYGWFGPDEFFKDVLENTNAVRGNPAHKEVSPYESSLRVGDANNGRGNSSGYRISYYNLGWLVGMCLDLEIRSRSTGKHSLDDVMRALFALCRNGQPGFEEDEIRKQVIRFGGEGMGEYFDNLVMKPGEMPIEDALAKAGVKMGTVDEDYLDPGFTYTAGFGEPGPSINEVQGWLGDSVKKGDRILEIDGASLTAESRRETMAKMSSAMGKLQAGQPAKMKVRRGEQDLDVTFTPRINKRPVVRVAEDPNASEAAMKLRQGWYFAGKK